MSQYDLAIVGAGPGGYVAAIRAAQHGVRIALIERDCVGGVCLNRGCIPTKTLIASAKALSLVRKAKSFGVAMPEFEPRIEMGIVNDRKNSVVLQLRQGIEKLLSGWGIELIKGSASFARPGKISVDGNEINSRFVLIATGSKWIDLPNIEIDGNLIVTSDHVLEWRDLPSNLTIIGGGVVGCEFACMMQKFGTKVTLIEATNSILPNVERAISRILARHMKEAGIDLMTNTTVSNAHCEDGHVKYLLSNGEGRCADRLLVAAGRRPLIGDMNIEASGMKLGQRGEILVDERFETAAIGTFAIGDVIGGKMLAHAASAQGIAAVGSMFERKNSRTVWNIPSPIFTDPEIASVGLTAEELEAKGIEFHTGRFPFAANGKALCEGESHGQAIIHADKKGKVIGAHIIGLDATSLIQEAVLAIDRGVTTRELADSIHGHPTLTEVVAEAAEDVIGKAIHKARAVVKRRDA